MKQLRHFVITILISSACFVAVAQSGSELTAQQFEQAIKGKDSLQILDVRTAGEFNTGHLKNALLADWKDEQEFARRISFIDKNKPVYIYCLSGGRSAVAAQKMKAAGYMAVYELKGGINAWKAAGQPVEGMRNEKQMTVDAFNKSIKQARVVLVDFGAEWCPPCKKMEPVLTNLQKGNAGKYAIVKVDGGRDQDILKMYQVTSLPVFIIFKNGKQVWRKDGIVSGEELVANLK